MAKSNVQMAMAAGMAAHNEMAATAISHDVLDIVDRIGNKYILHVFVTADRKAGYMMAAGWDRSTQAIGNVFLANFPTDPTIFDDHDDFLAAVMATRNTAKTITIRG